MSIINLMLSDEQKMGILSRFNTESIFERRYSVFNGNKYFVVHGKKKDSVCYGEYYYDMHGREHLDDWDDIKLGDLSEFADMRKMKVRGFDLYKTGITGRLSVAAKDKILIDRVYKLNFEGCYPSANKELLKFRVKKYSPTDKDNYSVLLDVNGTRPIHFSAFEQRVYNNGIILSRSNDEQYNLYDYTTDNAVILLGTGFGGKLYYNEKTDAVRFLKKGRWYNSTLNELRMEYDANSGTHSITKNLETGETSPVIFQKSPPIFQHFYNSENSR